MKPIIVRTRGYVASLDADRCDTGVIKCNGEEGKVSIARRCWNDTGEDNCAVPVEVLDSGTCAVWIIAKANATWLIDVCEHYTEGFDGCRCNAI